MPILINLLICLWFLFSCKISHKNNAKKFVRETVNTNKFQKSICFKYAVLGISDWLPLKRVYKQSWEVKTNLIVVAKCILSLRNNGTIVITMVENEGKYAFMNKYAGFLCKTNIIFTFDPLLVSSKKGSLWIVNWFNSRIPKPFFNKLPTYLKGN